MTSDPSRSAASIFLFSLFAWTVSNLDQSLFGYAVPGIATEFGVGLETIGLILSVSFATAAILVIFAGLAADRYGRRYTLAAVLAGSALFVGLHGYATTPMRLLVLRSLAFGLAAGVAPITSVYVAEAAPARHRGLWMGILQCGYPLGWFLASLIAAPLLASHGWRSIFLVGFAVVPIALLIAWRLPESDRFARIAKNRRAGGGLNFALLGALFSHEYRRRSLLCLLLFFTFGCAYAGTAFYFPTFFVSVRGYTPAEAATLVGSSNGIAVLGYLLAAIVGEYVWNRRNTYALWCAIGAVALLGLMWIPATRSADLAFFAITGAFFYGSNAVVGTLLADLYPTSMRATAYAVCGSAPLSVGFAVYPAIVPLVVASVGWQQAFSVAVVPVLMLSALTALWLPSLRSGEELADSRSPPFGKDFLGVRLMMLEGKVALVTGAGRRQGLGQAICARLAADGCRIALTDLAAPKPLMDARNIGTRAEMEDVARELAKIGPQVIALPMDVREEAEIETTIAAVLARFGRLDILVNNAGIGYLFSPIVDTPVDFWKAVMDVNLMGPFLCTKHAARQMILQGGGGRVINIASQAAKSGHPHLAAYIASKHGLVGLTRTAALELGGHGITVNAVCPNHVTTGLGSVQNDYYAKLRGVSVEQYLDDMRRGIAMGRVGLPTDTANACAFLCSDQAAYITGEAMNVSGGAEMH